METPGEGVRGGEKGGIWSTDRKARKVRSLGQGIERTDPEKQGQTGVGGQF